MVFQNGPSDRMQLVGLGDMVHPASCMVCGNGNFDGGYVNLGVWYEYQGNMYLCRTCCVQAAEIIGCLVPEEADHLQTLSEGLAELNASLTSQLEEANARLAVFDGALAAISARDFTGRGSLISGDDVQEQPVPINAAAETIDGTDGGESKPPKPVKSTGRTDSSGSKPRDTADKQNGIQL